MNLFNFGKNKFSQEEDPELQDPELRAKFQGLFGGKNNLVQQTNALDESDAPPLVSSPEPQPERSLKDRLFGYSDKPVMDEETGLAKPVERHKGLFGKIAPYALPAIVGMAGGVGALPGLMMGYAGERRNENAENAAERKQYNLDKTAMLGMKKEDKRNELAANREARQEKYQNAMLGMTGARLSLDREKSQNGGLAQLNRDRDDERSFRQDFLNNQTTKTYNEAITGFKKIEETVKSKDPSGFSDQALIFNFNKVMDPGSVVREGEYNATMKNAGMFDQLGINIQKVLNGKKLSPEMRQKLYETAKLQMKASQDRFSQFRDEQSRIAKEYGYEPNRVIPDIEYKDAAPNTQRPLGATGKAPAADGTLHYHDAQGNDLGPV